MKLFGRERHKKFKSAYQKRINLALTIYCVYIILCELSVLLAFAVPRESLNSALCICLGVACALFVGGSLFMLLYVIPRLKKAQAHIDFARCDFSPYVSEGKSEIFYCEYHLLRCEFGADPFDGDQSFKLTGEKAFNDYIKQFADRKILGTERFESGVYDSPFFIGYFFGDEKAKMRIDKKVSGDKVTVDVYELHRAEFTESGVIIGDKQYSYDEIETDVSARFSKQTNFTVSVRATMLFSDEGVLSFVMSSRIAAVIRRFGIEPKDNKVFEYILKDPKRAFEQTARQWVLKKLV